MLDAEQALEGAVQPDGTAATASLRFAVDPYAVASVMGAGTDDGAPLLVMGNHGRWVVECPDGDGGAQFASREDRRFMCIECLNASVSGLWRPVEWPAEVVELEAVLDARAAEENRNWVPGQTVDDLVVEDEQAPASSDDDVEVEG